MTTRLGLYDTLRYCKSSTVCELAEEAGIAPRYARQWLEQQAVAGVLVVDDETADAETRRCSLPVHTSAWSPIRLRRIT